MSEERELLFGTGRDGAIMQLTAIWEVYLQMIYQRDVRDIERSLIKQMVDLETADWPEGAYTISSKSHPISYNGISIFEYMKYVRHGGVKTKYPGDN